MKLIFETPRARALVQEKFVRAGVSGVESSWKAVNEIRTLVSRYVKVANIKIVNHITNGIADTIQKSHEIDLQKFLDADIDLIKALNPKKIKASSPALLKYEGDPPDPSGDVSLQLRAGYGGFSPLDFDKIDDVVFYYLHDIATPAVIDGVAKAYRAGMITGDMSEMKVSDKKAADMNFGDLEDWAGNNKFIKRIKADGISEEYAFAADWAKDHAASSIAIYDENGNRAGKAYETIMQMFRDQVAYTLARGEDISRLKTRLIFPEEWTDVEGHQKKLSDMLSAEEMRQYTVAHLNRDWDRLAFDQMQRAFQAGRLTRWSAGGLPTYAKFWRVRDKGKQCPKCREWQGTPLRVFRSIEDFQNSPYYGGEDLVVNDEKAEIAVWPGKSNDDRKYRDWWVCCPTHPHCNDDYVLI